MSNIQPAAIFNADQQPPILPLQPLTPDIDEPRMFEQVRIGGDRQSGRPAVSTLALDFGLNKSEILSSVSLSGRSLRQHHDRLIVWEQVSASLDWANPWHGDDGSLHKT